MAIPNFLIDCVIGGGYGYEKREQKQFTMSANNYGYYTRFKERLNDDWKKGGYTIEAYKKVVVEMSRKNFFTDNSIPAGTYKEKYIVISKDSKNPMASVGITIVK